MKLAQLSGAEPSTPKLVKSNHRPKKQVSQSEPVQIKLKKTPAVVSGAEAKTMKEFIATVIAERLGPISSNEDDLSEIFSE
jgi:3-deoxy-D-arabino-heptulosonate 7-phosphate (DAHP) synthase class II